MYYQVKFILGEKLYNFGVSASTGNRAIEKIKDYVFRNIEDVLPNKISILEIKRSEFEDYPIKTFNPQIRK